MLRRAFPGSCPGGCGACARGCRHICQQGWALWSTSPTLLGITPGDETKRKWSMPQAPIPSNPARRVGEDCRNLSNELTGSILDYRARMRMAQSVCQLVDFSAGRSFPATAKNKREYAGIRKSASQRAAE